MLHMEEFIKFAGSIIPTILKYIWIVLSFQISKFFLINTLGKAIIAYPVIVYFGLKDQTIKGIDYLLMFALFGIFAGINFIAEIC